MKFFQSRRRSVRLLSFLLAFCVLFGGLSLVQSYRLRQIKLARTAATQRAAQELCENLDRISSDLQKSVFCNSSTQLSALALDLSKCAACAKCSLSELTDEALVSDELYKFLSQVGDFTVALSKKTIAKAALPADDRKSLAALSAYAQSLSDAVSPVSEGVFDGTVTLEKAGLFDRGKQIEQPKQFSDEINQAEQSLAAYPTLLYDGPFADARLNRNALAVKGKDEISAEAAAKRAAEFLGCSEQQLLREHDVDGVLPLFCFSKGEFTISITKRGGLLCSILSAGSSGAPRISESAATRIAKRFLRDAGYPDMKESYYSTYDGICTVNLAYAKKGVIYYADLIKVSVALDTGAVCAVDARGYLMNHTDRTLPKQDISMRDAVRLLAPNLTLLDTALALIPCDDGRERLCYELHCKSDDQQEVLVYVDVTTGEEADLQLLLYSDNGVLAK